MILLALGVTAILSGLLFITLVNLIVFPRLQLHAVAPHARVSILIPARNEAPNIARTIRHILDQEDTNLELVVLDDQSEDETAAVAERAAAGDPRFRVIPGQDLPEGWLGKNWACHQLAQKATGSWLVFTDADVQWRSQALSSLMQAATTSKADLLTVWPTQRTLTWGERLIVPLMALTVVGYLPLPLVHHTPWPVFAAANGQCLLFQRHAYEAIGGHEAVRSDLVEDIALSRRIKGQGLRLRMADGNNVITCRMYAGWEQVRDGYAKNIIAGYGSVFALILATIFHWVVFLGPLIWLIAGAFASEGAWSRLGWPGWPLLLLLIGIGLRALTAAGTRQRVGDALGMPLSVLLMTAIAARAIWWQWRQGGPSWKGRVINQDALQKAQDHD